MASVAMEHVSKSFGDVDAVRDLSVEVPAGEVLVIVGPSGCGKTTALRMIAGLETPDRGIVRIDGRIVNDVEPRDRNVAMVFEGYALYPNMDVRDNLAFPLRVRKTPAQEIQQRIDEVAGAFEIDPLLEQKPGTLATGEAQHVAVGHAVMRKAPAVFLLDDAFSHLDAHQRLDARAELGRLHRELKATIVSVTHDQAEALAIGTHVAVMHAGVLMQADSPSELYEHPANVFVAGFIGSPPMNLIEMTLERAGGVLVLRRETLTWPVPSSWTGQVQGTMGARVIVGVRPEHIRVGRPPSEGEAGLVGRCEHIEYLGHGSVVHLRVAGAELLASTDPTLDIGAGDDLECSATVDRLHFFDPGTGHVIGRTQTD